MRLSSQKLGNLRHHYAGSSGPDHTHRMLLLALRYSQECDYLTHKSCYKEQDNVLTFHSDSLHEPAKKGDAVTEEEIEIVAEELAKIGGVSWYPGRTSGPLLRAVSDRYRDRAKVAIAALERVRASKGAAFTPKEAAETHLARNDKTASDRGDQLQVGTIVVYRPPEERRAIPCRVESLEANRAYLVPCPRPDIGWVSTSELVPLDPATDRRSVK